jgi:cell division protein ZapE
VLRRHFHRFMGKVHAVLNDERDAGRSDPLAAVAEQIAGRCKVLCLDEFVVHDIGDAMILSGLLEHLVARDVTLVTTSNTEPAGLYRDGLQRARFEPAIALLQRHCEVIELDSPTDYRLRSLTRAPVYLVPAGDDADARLRERFDELAPQAGAASHDAVGSSLLIEGRQLAARAVAEGVAWFDFAALCQGPRAVADYIELARRLNTVLVSDVPRFGEPSLDDAAKRFIHLIDEFYDRRVKLLLSADVDATDLYRAGRLRSQFERTESRLIEMQGSAYLALPHRP